MNGLRRLVLLGALAGLSLLGGCSSTPRASSSAGDSSVSVHAGRMALRVAAFESRQAQSLAAEFELRGNAEQGELKLFSPLGTSLAQARWQAGLAELWVATQGKRSFASLDDLAEQALGERVPLAALPDWLAGRPWPLAVHTSTPTGFEQLGWNVDLSQMAQGRLIAQRAAQPAVLLRVTLEGQSGS